MNLPEESDAAILEFVAVLLQQPLDNNKIGFHTATDLQCVAVLRTPCACVRPINKYAEFYTSKSGNFAWQKSFTTSQFANCRSAYRVLICFLRNCGYMAKSPMYECCFFKEKHMNCEVSLVRLYAMRLLFLLNFVFLGADVWPALFSRAGSWDPVQGVAYSFWAALSLLSLVGLRYPLQMLPILLMQFAYKCIWLIFIAATHWPEIKTDGLFAIMAIGLIVDIAVIPWGYFFTHYVRKTGDRWK